VCEVESEYSLYDNFGKLYEAAQKGQFAQVKSTEFTWCLRTNSCVIMVLWCAQWKIAVYIPLLRLTGEHTCSSKSLQAAYIYVFLPQIKMLRTK
jgi:hypothetical protein